MNSVIIYFALLIGITITNGATIPDDVRYLTEVLQHLIHKIQEEQITGNAMPLKEITRPMAFQDFGIIVQGNIVFTDGFVMKIEGAKNGRLITSAVTDTASSVLGSLVFTNLEVAYNMRMTIPGQPAFGAFIMLFPELSYDVNITKAVNTNNLTGHIEFRTITSSSDLVVRISPYNDVTQFIGQQMRSGFANREEILNSIRDWDSLFLRHLTDSINEVPFPDICYYCTNVRPGNPST